MDVASWNVLFALPQLASLSGGVELIFDMVCHDVRYDIAMVKRGGEREAVKFIGNMRVELDQGSQTSPRSFSHFGAPVEQRNQPAFSQAHKVPHNSAHLYYPIILDCGVTGRKYFWEARG